MSRLRPVILHELFAETVPQVTYEYEPPAGVCHVAAVELVAVNT